MHDLVQRLQSDNPAFSFVEGKTFVWSPEHQQITYASLHKESGPWSLLHELSHALLSHTSYGSDIDLLQKEVEAWERAAILGQQYSISIDENFVESCLDSYRDWLHKRSVCPACRLQGIQKDHSTYICLNCNNSWGVTKERFCRPYRRSQLK